MRRKEQQEYDINSHMGSQRIKKRGVCVEGEARLPWRHERLAGRPHLGVAGGRLSTARFGVKTKDTERQGSRARM